MYLQKGCTCLNNGVAVGEAHQKWYQLMLVSWWPSERQSETGHVLSCVGVAS